MLGMEYPDEKTSEGFKTCHQHTVRIVSILGAAKFLFSFVVLNRV